MTPLLVYSSFLPDVPGVYVAELIVFDSQMPSSRDHVFITVAVGNSGLGAPPNSGTPPPAGPPTQIPPLPFPHPPVVPFLLIGLAMEEILIPNTAPVGDSMLKEW